MPNEEHQSGMIARIPIMVKDRMMEQYGEMPLTENFIIRREAFFLNGPVTRRIAVIDLDPTSGELVQGCCFDPPAENHAYGSYRIADPKDNTGHDFMQVSVFGTVLKTRAGQPSSASRRLSR